MELKEFIEKSLTQISEGVEAANKIIRENNTDIRPAYLLTSGKDQSLKQTENPSKISFDVAVTSTSSIKGDASGSASILAVVDANLEGSISKQNQNVSRVKFEVTVDRDLGIKRIE